ncbi:MAG: starch-binding protein, partial [Muribaculaceae bacterium]|nr:starch-binding protein [Muribaculaceae bacterium]
NSTNQNYAFYVNSELGGLPDTGGNTTTTVPDIATPVEGKTYAYFEAPSSWNGVKAWAWSGEGENIVNLTGSEWPGTGDMTKVGENNGNNVWLWTADSSVNPSSILFNGNDGADQTADFTFTNGGYYTQNGLIGTVSGGGGSTGGDVQDGEVTIYVDTKAHIYAWAGEGDTYQELTPTWPGTELSQTKTIDGKTWYYITFNKKPVNVVLNSGLDAAQSGDFKGLSEDTFFEYDLTTGNATIVNGQGGQGTGSGLPECATFVEGKTFVYFEAPSTWASDVKVWAWNASGNLTGDTWPGTGDMTKVGTNGSNNVYRWEAESSVVPTGLLFNCNSGNTQTGDFTFTNGGYYTVDGLKATVTNGQGGQGTGGDELPECATYVDGKTFAYFEAPNTWASDVKAWAWNEGGNLTGDTWPGTGDMTKVGTNNGNDVYRWEAESTVVPTGILFNCNNGGTQTGDFTFTNGGYYTINGLKATVTKTGGGDTPEPGKTITVYVKSQAGANIYAWTGADDSFRELTAQWPGDALSATKVVNDVTWYYKEFNAESVNLVLNSGLDQAQSENIEGLTQDTFIEYDINTGVAKVVDGTSSGDTPAGKVTVYVSSTDPATNIYAWDSDGELTAAWPGDALTATKTVDGKSWYYKEFNKATVNVVINNNAGATQSADFANITSDIYIVYNPATGEGTDVTSTIGQGGGETGIQDGEVTVYVETNDENPHIYAWVGEGTAFAEMTAAWPGTALTQTKVVDNRTWYYMTFNKYPLNVVLNCGDDATKTADITGITKDIYLVYDASQNKATDVTDNINKGEGNQDGIIPACATYVEGKTFAYFEAPAVWTTPVNVWAWTIYDNFNGEWPGTAMTKVGKAANGNDVYQWIYDGSFTFLPEQILFDTVNANNETEQTDNFDFTNGGYYTMAGLLGVVTKNDTVPGDVNGDGVVSGADVTALYNMLLDGAAGNGDVNGDGVVSGADVTALYNILLN